MLKTHEANVESMREGRGNSSKINGV